MQNNLFKTDNDQKPPATGVPLDAIVSVPRHLDLFSGIGGFALAAKWAGFETVAFCEIEEYPRKVLAKNFPGVPVHNDIKDLNGGEYEGIELITGGYPCQPFSVAGKRRGKEDHRHLWPEMLRVITQARPAWVVCENVAGHVTLGLDKVLTDLEHEGYSARAFVIPACGADARHQRDRVWIVGNSNSIDAARVGRSERENIHAEKWKIKEEVEARNLWLSELGAGEITPRGDTYTGALRKLDGVPHWMDRHKCLGNAIVPQIAYRVLMAIRAH